MSQLAIFEFDGASAVITGAGSGIGRAVAHSLAARSTRVLVTDVDAARAERVAQEIVANGGAAVAQPCDVRHLDQLEAARERCLDEFGRVDIVVNNVGVMVGGRPEAIPVAEWERILDINVLGMVRSNEVFLPQLLDQRSGHIVNTASASGLLNYAYDRAPYAITKAAVLMLSENLFLYLRPYGVGVSCLCPTGVITNILEQMRIIGEPLAMGKPEHAIVAADVVGERVADAIADRRFLVVTADTVIDELRRKGADLDAYLLERERWIHATQPSE
jgi:NAD(P)-dependent dehydrogenase (short-subunit alcohol dehydrogenase family)